MQVLCIDMSRCKGGAGVFALAEYLPLMDKRSGYKKVPWM
jgi:hypothetical protein